MLRKRFYVSNFARSTAVLAAGSAGSQCLTVLTLPFLTRLYEPEAFGYLAVYVATISTLCVFACLRMDIAIPLPEDDSDAANILLFCIAASVTTSLLVGTFSFCNRSAISESLGFKQSEIFVFILPIGVLSASLYSSVQYWATRKRRFNTIAQTRITQSFAGLALQIVFGLKGASFIGLQIGQLVSSGSGTLRLASQTIRDDRKHFSSATLKGIQCQFMRYKSIAKFSAFEELFLIAGVNAPIFMIAYTGATAEVGLFLLASKVISTPVSLVGSAVAQVYYADAANSERDAKLEELSTKVVDKLAIYVAAPILFLATFSFQFFGLAFGDEWQQSGFIMLLLLPSVALRLISSPISMSMHVKMKQKSMLSISFVGFVMRAGAVALTAFFLDDFIIEAFAAASLAFYLLCYFAFLSNIGVQCTIVAKKLSFYLCIWAVSSALGCTLSIFAVPFAQFVYGTLLHNFGEFLVTT